MDKGKKLFMSFAGAAMMTSRSVKSLLRWPPHIGNGANSGDCGEVDYRMGTTMKAVRCPKKVRPNKLWKGRCSSWMME